MVRHPLQGRAVVAAFLTACLITAAGPLQAQTTEAERIEALEQKLNSLLQNAEALREEIDALKQGKSSAIAPPADDLTAVDVIAPPDDAADAAAVPETTTDAEEITTVDNAPAPATAKIFNPDLSIIATVNGHAGDRNPFEYGEDEARGPIDLGEVELAFEAFVDPYAKGKFFLAIGEEGIEVEEGYAEFLTLPWDLTARVGKKKALFGKANTWHTHVRPWNDQPLLIHNFFGDEGLADTGISVSTMLPTSSFYTEVTAELFSGNAEGIFERQSENDLFLNTHLRLFRDLNENSNLEVGGSYARGTTPEIGGSSQFTGVDVSYRWKPLQQGSYRGFTGRFEAMVSDRDDLEDRLTGFYGSGEFRVARRWLVGARVDQADRSVSVVDALEDAIFTDRGASLLLTFQPSEFSQFRTQLRRTSYGGAEAVNELLVQLQFAIGAHGAHTF